MCSSRVFLCLSFCVFLVRSLERSEGTVLLPMVLLFLEKGHTGEARLIASRCRHNAMCQRARGTGAEGIGLSLPFVDIGMLGPASSLFSLADRGGGGGECLLGARPISP